MIDNLLELVCIEKLVAEITITAGDALIGLLCDWNDVKVKILIWGCKNKTCRKESWGWGHYLTIFLFKREKEKAKRKIKNQY